MSTQRIIADEDFARIIIRTRINARNITMRLKEDGLYIIVPPYTSTRKIMQVVDLHRDKLKDGYTRMQPPKKMDFSYSIDAPCFKLTVQPGTRQFFSVRCVDDEMIVYCPPNIDLECPENQKMLRMAIIRAMKQRAAAFLPPVLAEHAAAFGLTYRKVKISSSRSRWGSCSSLGSINLSCYLMLLPPHLMDYVMLHELAHLREMNHGPQFWALLDEMTGGMALLLRSELKKFRIML